MKKIIFSLLAINLLCVMIGSAFAAPPQPNVYQNKQVSTTINALYIYNQKTLKDYATNTEYKLPPAPVKNQEFLLYYFLGKTNKQYPTVLGCTTDDKGLVYWDYLSSFWYAIPPKYITTYAMEKKAWKTLKLYYWKISPDKTYSLGTVNTAQPMSYWPCEIVYIPNPKGGNSVPQLAIDVTGQ